MVPLRISRVGNIVPGIPTISGPSFNGVSFSYPDEPFSTNGHQVFDCQQRSSCTNMVKIPLGKALSDMIPEKVLILTGFEN